MEDDLLRVGAPPHSGEDARGPPAAIREPNLFGPIIGTPPAPTSSTGTRRQRLFGIGAQVRNASVRQPLRRQLPAGSARQRRACAARINAAVCDTARAVWGMSGELLQCWRSLEKGGALRQETGCRRPSPSPTDIRSVGARGCLLIGASGRRPGRRSAVGRKGDPLSIGREPDDSHPWMIG